MRGRDSRKESREGSRQGRRVRFQRRRIDADRLPLHQTRSSQPFQHPRENRHVRFHVDQTPRAATASSGSAAPRSRPGPGKPADSENPRPATQSPAPTQTLEVADEQQPEIPPRTQTRAAPAATRRTPRTTPPQRHRIRPPPEPGSAVRKRDVPRSSEGPLWSPTSVTAVAPPASCPLPCRQVYATPSTQVDSDLSTFATGC